MIGHPTGRRLQRWLDGVEPDLDAHLGACSRCAERLERLEPDEQPLRQPLMELLRPPEQLPERLRSTINARLRARDDLTLFGELFGLPIRAVRVMTTGTPGDP